MVADALRTAHGWPEDRIEIVPITTTGDIIQDRPLAEVGGKALWTKELDRCLSDGRTDVSVHSMKDVETFRPTALTIAAMLPRADVRDRLIGASGIASLSVGARVGTSSPRRSAQLLRRRPDLDVVAFRGNVGTRLSKLKQGEADATLLAAAGLDRLGRHDVGVAIEVTEMLPAPAQAAVGIEVRTTDQEMYAIVDAIDNRPTHLCVSAERRLLEALGGDCKSPIAALAVLEEGLVWLRAEILSQDGRDCESGESRFAIGDDDAPAELAAHLLARASPTLRALFRG
jgi:hydroxymethylbilane synthase